MSLKPVCGLNWLERWALHKVLEEKKYYFRTSLTSISSPLLPTCMSLTLGPFSFTHGVLSQSLVSDSLKPHGLQPSRLLCPWGFSRQEYQSGLPCPPSGDLPNPGIKSRSPTLQENSLPSEPPGKHVYTGITNILCEYWVTKEQTSGCAVRDSGIYLKQFAFP